MYDIELDNCRIRIVFNSSLPPTSTSVTLFLFQSREYQKIADAFNFYLIDARYESIKARFRAIFLVKINRLHQSIRDFHPFFRLTGMINLKIFTMRIFDFSTKLLRFLDNNFITHGTLFKMVKACHREKFDLNSTCSFQCQIEKIYSYSNTKKSKIHYPGVPARVSPGNCYS